MAIRGMLSVEELRAKVFSEEIETILVMFTDMYGRFVGKRFDAEFFVEDTLHRGTHACNYLLTVDMEMEPVPGYEFANWEKGYGDFHLVPDLSSLRIASWLEKTAIVICDVKEETTHQLLPFVPRSLLKRQIEQLENLVGGTAVGASELEYYLYETSYQDAAEKGYAQLTPAGWYIEDYHILQGTREEEFHGTVRKHLKHSGIPVESSKGEWGKGQHELNVRYTHLLEMADRHSLYKQCLKEIANEKWKSVTFMAKPSQDTAGSSCHLHLSLWKDGKNVFNEAGNPSDLFTYFLGGWIAHAAEMMVFYAPTINSYKRYQSGSWAPTKLAWSRDNRTAGFRIVGSEESLRIECRIPGADCNPYLAFCAALASGIDGIQNQIEPPPEFNGDVYQANHLPQVPKTLAEAVEKFASSTFAQQTLGEKVHQHYLHFFQTEVQAYQQAVTDWERKRYFERI